MASCYYFLSCFCFLISGIYSKSDNSVLVRNKRYIAFPEGASLSVALCLTQNSFIPRTAPIEITEGVNWGISYDLPNATTIQDSLHKVKHVQQRSIRRDIYDRIETVLDSMGLEGRSCLLRALCESQQKILPIGKNIIEELLEIVFRFPLQRIQNSEPEIHRFYHRARRMGKARHRCDSLFPECQFSLLNLVLNFLNYAD